MTPPKDVFSSNLPITASTATIEKRSWDYDNDDDRFELPGYRVTFVFFSSQQSFSVVVGVTLFRLVL